MAEHEERLLERRLAALQLAETLGNVTEACRLAGITRTQFYAYRQRYEAFGREGLRNRPPIPGTHPRATPVAWVEKIVALALARPGAGCDEIERLLAADGMRVSSVTVQKQLSRHGLGSRRDRWLALEQQMAAGVLPLTAEQAAFVEKHNPCHRHRQVRPARPAQRLSQDTLFVGRHANAGSLYLHFVVDTFGSHAFACLHTSKRPEAAVALLHDDVLPFYEGLGLVPETILTGHGREFCGGASHPFELYLLLNAIDHRRDPAHARNDGFAERFRRTVRGECRGLALQYADMPITLMQQELDAWLLRYNRKRPHPGYPNHGRTPWQTIQEFIAGRSGAHATAAARA